MKMAYEHNNYHVKTISALAVRKNNNQLIRQVLKSKINLARITASFKLQESRPTK
jgi:hypothetical protein